MREPEADVGIPTRVVDLATVRRLGYWLLDTPMDFHQASCRRAAIPHEPAFLAGPELEGDGAVKQRGVSQADGHSLSDLRRLSLSIHGGRFRRGATLPAATRPRSPG